MKVNTYKSLLVLCTVALCLQGCPITNQPQTNTWEGTGVVWMYSPKDSVYVSSYYDISSTPKKNVEYHVPDSCFIVQYIWDFPSEKDGVLYDEKYHALHVRKLSNRDTTFAIEGGNGFYLNDSFCRYSTWIIPNYLYQELDSLQDSLRTKYAIKQIIDSIRVHYPHLVTPICDSEEHIFRLPKDLETPRIVIE